MRSIAAWLVVAAAALGKGGNQFAVLGRQGAVRKASAGGDR